MKIKLISVAVMALILISTTSIFSVQSLEAYEGVIYLRSDGTIDPPSAPISVDGTTYILTSDIYGSIVIQKDGITLDGISHIIQGTSTYAIGIDVSYRTGIIIKNFTVKQYSNAGINLGFSSQCIIINNMISGNYLRGILLYASTNNYIMNNTIIDTGWDGIWLKESSNYNTVTRNTFENNHNTGIDVSRSSNNNLIYENNLLHNNIGVEWGVNPASNNVLYHNNFIDNIVQTLFHTSANNTWDDNYPSGGNYWSDYVGIDDYKGPSQNILGSDMIGDTPYIIDGQNIDNYPLMNPYNLILERPTYVTIDIFTVNKNRVDVGTTQSVRVHAKWDNGTDVSEGIIYINHKEYETNSSGWVVFNEDSSSVCKKTWKVTAINCSGVYDFTQTASSPSIIWDRVNVTLSITDNRIDINSKPDVKWSAIYEYDGSPFQGEVNMKIFSSITSTPTPVSKGSFTVESIEDEKYGLTAFTSNQVDCIWDRVKIIQGGVSNSKAKTGDMESVWFKAVYEYDNKEFTGEKGVIYVNNQPMTWSSYGKTWKYSTKLDDNGKLTFEVSGVEDRQYKLTTFIDAAGPQSITWEKPFLETPLGIASIAAVLAVIAAGTIFFLRKRI